jgi:hypothetical protein
MARTILKVSSTQREGEHQQQLPRQQHGATAAEPPPSNFHRLYTIREAAALTGLKYWLLLRAVNSGDVPGYVFGNARRRVRLPDIEAAIAQAGQTRGRA